MQNLKLSALVLSLTLSLAAGVARAQSPPGPAGAIPAPVPLFSDKERGEIVAYWQAPGRYTIAAPPNALTDGPFQVRLTAEGSAWFYAYQRAVGAGGKFIPPTKDARPTNGPFAAWDAWVGLKLAYDRAMAQQAADNANRLILSKPTVAAPALGATTGNNATQVLLGGTSLGLPPAPGAIPASLLAVVGNPPPLAGVVVPLLYTVTFDKPDEFFSYTDNVKLRERYAYYRFPRGVVSYGAQLKDMAPEERDGLFRAAGFSEGDQRIFAAVSKLEGGFETVQTYDTGYVSIGFIQFVTLGDGKADLSNVLREMKASEPKAFKEDFRRFGIDVAPDLSLTVIDPATGAELRGNPAVLKIIDDKRLTAVFQRAGRKDPFRIAQIKIARSYYWPQFDPLTIALADGTAAVGTVGDIVKSEAGLATLLDRKINTGNIRSLTDVVSRCMTAHGCKTLTDLAPYEKEIVAAMTYRTNFLADATLAQPAAPPVAPTPYPGFIPLGPPAPGQSETAPPVTALSPAGQNATTAAIGILPEKPKGVANSGLTVTKGIVIPADPLTLPANGAANSAKPATPAPVKAKDGKDKKGKDKKPGDDKTKPTPTPTPTPAPPPADAAAPTTPAPANPPVVPPPGNPPPASNP